MALFFATWLNFIAAAISGILLVMDIAKGVGATWAYLLVAVICALNGAVFYSIDKTLMYLLDKANKEDKNNETKND